MPIIVTEPGPDGTLQTVAEPSPAPDAAPPSAGSDPGESAPPAPPAAPAPAEPAPPASAPDAPDRPETTEDDEDDRAAEPVSRGVQRKIDREVRRRHEAERKAAAIEARLQMLEQGYQRQPQTPEPVPLHQQPEPREEDYASQQEWFKATREWDKAQLKAEMAREQHQQRLQAAQAQQQAKMVEQAQAARQHHADFDQVMDRLNSVYTSPALDACVHESELGAELAYYLAQHPDEIARLNQVAQTAPLAMAREIGKLEMRLAPPTASNGSNGSTPSRPPPAPLPTPVTPLSGTGSPGQAEPDFEQMSQREFEAWWKRQYPGQR